MFLFRIWDVLCKGSAVLHLRIVNSTNLKAITLFIPSKYLNKTSNVPMPVQVLDKPHQHLLIINQDAVEVLFWPCNEENINLTMCFDCTHYIIQYIHIQLGPFNIKWLAFVWQQNNPFSTPLNVTNIGLWAVTLLVQTSLPVLFYAIWENQE